MTQQLIPGKLYKWMSPKPFNTTHIGIFLNTNTEKLTKEDIEGYKKVVKFLKSKFKYPITSHRFLVGNEIEEVMSDGYSEDFQEVK